jgi:hypothetical protein
MEFLQEITWRPRIGDPSFMGWFTVIAYAVTVMLALSAARRPAPEGDAMSADRVAWFVVATLMGFLCINKQLDLQSLLADLGRILARQQGWYGSRHEVLGWFVYAIGSVFLVGATVLAVLFPRFWRRHALLGAGLVFLLCFIAVRALSLHQFDAIINYYWHGIRMNWLLELSGIGAIALAGARARRG